MTAPASDRAAVRQSTPDLSPLARAASAVLASIATQRSLLIEFEAISTTLAEAAAMEDPSALEKLLTMRRALIDRLEIELESSREERELVESRRASLTPAIRAELDENTESLRRTIAAIAERDVADAQRFREIRDAASRELAELDASKRAVRGYGGPVESGPAFQDQNA
jgi:hypothetical protein